MHDFGEFGPEDRAIAAAAWDALADGTRSFDDLADVLREQGLFEPLVPSEFPSELNCVSLHFSTIV